ncbi:MAG: DNA-processing protein DprA [Parvibaculaceae bacterium]
MVDAQRRDWLRLIKSENVGPATFQQLLNRYGGAAQALEALPELGRRGGLIRPIRIYPAEDADRDLERAGSLGARFVALGEPDYPPLLRHIDSAPPLVCMKGRLEILQQSCVALVGAREASALGRRFTRELAAAFGAESLTVVSGLARGIDTAAHEASLETGTVAVLAGGIDVIYPPENATLHEAIGERGVLLSEMTPGTTPRAEFFPRRNRLIAGMSLGVVVVEARLRSGSLITARLAGEMGREVFAVPGSPLDPRAGGTNRLIREGATLTTGPEDVLEVLRGLGERLRDAPDALFEPDEPVSVAPRDVPAGLREIVLSLLGASAVEIDDLIRESHAPAGAVLAVLLELEVAGRLERLPGQRVLLTSE